MTQPFQFATKRTDAGTGLVYYGYRFYAPEVGRWLTRDPLGEAGGLNLYAFTGNNPVNWVDFWGWVTRRCTAEKKRFFEWVYRLAQQMAKELDTDEDFLLTQAAQEGGWTDGDLDHNMPLNNPFSVNRIKNRKAAGNVAYGSLDDAMIYWIKRYKKQVQGARTALDFVNGLECIGVEGTCYPYNADVEGYIKRYLEVYDSVKGYKDACKDVIDTLE